MAERLSVSDVIENNLGNGLSVLEMAVGSFTGAVYSLSRLVVVDDCSLVVNEAKPQANTGGGGGGGGGR